MLRLTRYTRRDIIRLNKVNTLYPGGVSGQGFDKKPLRANAPGLFREGVATGCKPPQSLYAEGRPEILSKKFQWNNPERVERHGLARYRFAPLTQGGCRVRRNDTGELRWYRGSNILSSSSRTEGFLFLRVSTLI